MDCSSFSSSSVNVRLRWGAMLERDMSEVPMDALVDTQTAGTERPVKVLFRTWTLNARDALGQRSYLTLSYLI